MGLIIENTDTQINHRANNREGKRHRILQSAIKAFAQKGFYNTKVAEIAKDAGVADGTIYLYFKNKDDILISLFEENMGGIMREFKTRLSEISDHVEKIRAFIRLHFDLIRTNPDLAAVIQLELRQSNKFMKEYSGTAISEYLNLISGMIHAGQAAGVFRQDIQPGIFKRALFGALDEISTLWVLSKEKNKKYDLDDSAEQIIRLFLHGVLNESHG